MSTTVRTSDAQARQNLQELLAKYHCKVHQPDDPPLFSREPKSPMRSHHWKWEDLRPLLDTIGQEIDLNVGGPRRTLRLTGPGLDRGTTPTFWASIQVILPGEVASAHRHSANAFRFVMEGGGATTTVNGESYQMNLGDLVLTPSWTWHDHEYLGKQPMIWLDVLDISLMHILHATFFDPYQEVTQPVSEVPDLSHRLYGSGLMRPTESHNNGRPVGQLLVYKKQVAEEALRNADGAVADPVDDVILEYQNPENGKSVFATLSLCLQKLRPGMRGAKRRNTGSRLYYVVRGQGMTRAGEAEFRWQAGDFIAIAPWDWHSHANLSETEEAILFQVNDSPTLKALGFYREEHAA
jgi:gentisate 1,2-dioxygenase